jgi:asparagine synthase (glutamine-hydrolysing)
MCGIWVLVDKEKRDVTELVTQFDQIAVRGPDYSSFETYPATCGNVYIGFHRLAIVNTSLYGNQPFILEKGDRTIVFVCNGEIYNWEQICRSHGFTCTNDCMVVPQLYLENPNEFQKAVSSLKGEFAFVLLEFIRESNGDLTLDKVVAARDEIGIRPMYYSPKHLFFTSEVKGAPADINVTEFPPGKLMTFYPNEIGLMYIDDFSTVYDVEPTKDADDVHLQRVRTSVMNAVNRRLHAGRPFAYLLSGGIDSSLVAALGSFHSHLPIKTFCCSIKEGTYHIGANPPFTTGPGTDLLFAREVAKHIRSDHTEVFFTPHEGLNAIKDVIRTIESWDTTTVRASVGQYMVCKWIGENTDCKVVMVGEGPDEVCSSYLFNWYCPNGKALEASAKDYVKNIHYYDVKRADRCISRWGLEGRVPLLDPEFIRAYWKIPGQQRLPKTRGIEKWWLREAFSPQMENRGEPFPLGNGSSLSGIMPESVRLRKKEAFSDGVSNSKSWYEMIQEFVDDKVTMEELNDAASLFPYCTPTTKEAYYYRRIFESIFPGRAAIVPGFWQPKWMANGQEVQGYVDPSARTLGVYQA